MIILKNLTKNYDGLKALDISNLEIAKGESFGLVGNNGAGKTTLFRLILDLIQPTTGEVLINGINVAHSEEWKHFTGSYLDEGFLIDFLRPDEYFELTAKLYGISAGDYEEFKIVFPISLPEKSLAQKNTSATCRKGIRKKSELPLQ